MKRRLGNIIVGQTRDKKYVRAAELQAAGAMTALLKDAFAPNLVQTIEGNPALIHGGPFANIAHGCNSVVATKAALKMADYVVTEAGFGADLGAEKFLDIKCRKAGLKPDCAVVVATIRALKMHGGVVKADLGKENVAAVEKGFANLARHIENVRKYGVPVVVCVNRFSADTPAETSTLKALCANVGTECVVSDHWAHGGQGAVDLGIAVLRRWRPSPPISMCCIPTICLFGRRHKPSCARFTAEPTSLGIRKCATVSRSSRIRVMGNLPVCIAKTQYSFSTDPDLKGAPKDHVVPIREVRLSAGAEFVVAICGNIMTMPGLPKVPAANNIDVTPEGRIVGLF